MIELTSPWWDSHLPDYTRLPIRLTLLDGFGRVIADYRLKPILPCGRKDEPDQFRLVSFHEGKAKK